MSVLNSTKTGAEYAKWLDDVHAFTIRTLMLGQAIYRNNKKASMWNYVNYNIDITVSDGSSFVFKNVNRKFRFLATWTVNEFKQEFLAELEKEKSIYKNIQDIQIPLEIVVENERP